MACVSQQATYVRPKTLTASTHATQHLELTPPPGAAKGSPDSVAASSAASSDASTWLGKPRSRTRSGASCAAAAARSSCHLGKRRLSRTEGVQSPVGSDQPFSST